MHPIRLTWKPLFSICCFAFLGFSNSAIATMRIAVSSKPPEALLFYPEHQASASAISLHDAKISAQTQGRIDTLPVLVGDSVKKGTVIATLACQDQRLDLEQAQSALRGTRAKIERLSLQFEALKKIAQSQKTAQERLKTFGSDLADYEAQLDHQMSHLNHAQLQIARCQVHAPFDAIVLEWSVALGEYVAPGTPLIRLLATDALEVKAKFHEKDLGQLENAKKMVFRSAEKEYPVRLRAKVQGVDENTHTQEVRFELTEAKPLPGTLGTLVWEENTAYLPADLLEQRDGAYGVFVSDNHTAHFVPMPWAVEGQPIPLKHALKHPLILEGRDALEEGMALSFF